MISIIIPAYNAENTIKKCLDSVSEQDYKNYEIIVVNDNSKDNTANIIKEYKKVKLISLDKNTGAGKARDIGVNKAKGEILAFTDSDCILPKDWLKKIKDVFNKEDVVAVAASYNGSEGKSFMELFSYYELLDRRKNFSKYISTASSSNFACFKKFYIQSGGFKTLFKNFTGEDLDLTYRISKIGKIYWDKENGILHHFPTKLKSYIKKQFRYARDTSILIKKYPDMLKNEMCQGGKNKIIIPILSISLILLVASIIYPILLIPFILIITVLMLMEYNLLKILLKNCGIYGLIKSLFVIYIRDLIWVFGIINGFLKYENKE